MSEKKTININPELLRMSAGKTRKNTGAQKKEIKMKQDAIQKEAVLSNATVRRRVMKHLRQKQDQENIDSILGTSGLSSSGGGGGGSKNNKREKKMSSSSSSPSGVQASVDDFKNSFEESLSFLENLTKKSTSSSSNTNTNNHRNKNTTFKKVAPRSKGGGRSQSVLTSKSVFDDAVHSAESLLPSAISVGGNLSALEDISLDMPEELALAHITGGDTIPYSIGSSSSSSLSSSSSPSFGSSSSSPFSGGRQHSLSSTSHPSSTYLPAFGCLKGGKLPTYRTWARTQKNHHHHHSSSVAAPSAVPFPVEPSLEVKHPHQHNPMGTTTNQGQGPGQGKSIADRRAEIRALFREQRKQDREKRKRNFQEQRQRIRKQKRTIRRTYRVGKSKVYPRVSVLVSNKTMRNRIQSVCQDLHKTPIEDVRKFLVKKGFIRVGSTCPNDVLRKMYESANLICGEIQNHNSDNFLYNYLNHAEL